MNKIRDTISNTPQSLKVLAALLISILIIGHTIALSSLVATTFEKCYLSRPICLSNPCVSKYIEETSQFFTISKATIDLGVAIATIGGIFVALLSYFNTASNAALTNHIEHLKVFNEYIDAEIKKKDRLSSQLFDSLLLYSTIFNQSRSGKTTVSDDYKNLISELNLIIEDSNKKSVSGTPGGFSYGEHQRKVKNLLAIAGITVYSAPRNDYLEMEEQLFSLIHRISQSFCSPNTVPAIKERKYH